MLDFYIERRDFGYGSGSISSDTTQFYINIPKSASTFVSSWMFSSGWTSTTVGRWGTDWDNINEVIIVMRDPIQRWLSGISQYMKGYILEYSDMKTFIKEYTNLTEKLVIDNLDIFDDHVWPQHCFFENILPETKRKYIYVNSNLEETLTRELNLAWPVPPDVDFNKSEDDPDLRELKQFFAERVQKNNNLRVAIQNIYRRDYEIINNNCVVC
jgi:hypothetical protein